MIVAISQKIRYVDMSPQVCTALKRLNDILPLVTGYKILNNDDAKLYCKLLTSYVLQGRTLTYNEVSMLVNNADESLTNIANNKLIVLDSDGNPSGAYPFTSEEREHKVHINGVTVHCMCALDALAVSPMFKIPTVIDSQCRVTGEPIHLQQDATRFNDGTVNAWFGINWGAAATDTVCAASLCMEMMFLANETVARDTREIFDLPSAAVFAAGFFVPLAEHCRQAA